MHQGLSMRRRPQPSKPASRQREHPTAEGHALRFRGIFAHLHLGFVGIEQVRPCRFRRQGRTGFSNLGRGLPDNVNGQHGLRFLSMHRIGGTEFSGPIA
jgi:hypothetical protein